MDDIEKELRESRGALYGPHRENAKDFAIIWNIFVRRGNMQDEDMLYVFNIIQKLTRLAQAPYHKDSHDDFRVYDKLWWESIEERGLAISDGK